MRCDRFSLSVATAGQNLQAPTKDELNCLEGRYIMGYCGVDLRPANMFDSKLCESSQLLTKGPSMQMVGLYVI